VDIPNTVTGQLPTIATHRLCDVSLLWHQRTFEPNYLIYMNTSAD